MDKQPTIGNFQKDNFQINLLLKDKILRVDGSWEEINLMFMQHNRLLTTVQRLQDKDLFQFEVHNKHLNWVLIK
jgi:hypothetical protein